MISFNFFITNDQITKCNLKHIKHSVDNNYFILRIKFQFPNSNNKRVKEINKNQFTSLMKIYN